MKSTSTAKEHNTKGRWWVFAAAWLVIFCGSAIAIYSVFSGPMTQQHGWSSAQFTLAYTVYNFVMAIVAIFAGLVADRYGVKGLLYIGGALYGLGWFLTGFATTLPMLYFSLSFVAGTGAGMIYNNALTTALRWFPDKGGLISGMLLSSAAIGPFLLSPASSFLIGRLGVRHTFQILGVFFVIVIFAVSWRLHPAPKNYRPNGWQPDANREENCGEECGWRVLLKSPLFYLLALSLLGASISGTMMISSVAVIARLQLGVTVAFSSLVVSISTLANFFGRLGFGWLYDKLGAIPSLAVNIVLSILSLAAMAFAHNLPLFIACVVVLGFSYGGILVMFPPLTGSIFGMANQSSNYAIVFLGYAFGSFFGPAIVSHFTDNAATFTPAYFIAAALSALGLLFVGLLHRSLKRRKIKT